MSLRHLLQRILVILLPLSIASTLYLYLYPIFQGCAFPIPNTKNINSAASSFASNAVVNTFLQHAADYSSTSPALQPKPAIFRLLVLADPQIEGDSSLPGPDDEFLARIRRYWEDIQSALVNGTAGNATSPLNEEELEVPLSVFAVVADAIYNTIVVDIPSALTAARKRLDLFGNDYYLAHIYRTLFWWSRPTHVTVLGDLIGSQWVTDEEFENRGWRYWHRVFRGGERVDDDITITGKKSRGDDESASSVETPELESLSRFNSSWARRIINIAGNHDIGYAGDVSKHRLERFERVFGRADWDLRFQHPPLEQGRNTGEADASIRPTLHIINLNDLTLDGPPFDPEIQSDSYTYINDLLSHRSHPVEDEASFTLLLTHVPLHKREGICVDSPHFAFFDDDDERDSENDTIRFHKDGLREQNHLSEHVSSVGILQGVFGMSGDTDAPAHGRGRRGLILTGHDHEGCDVVHFVNRTAVSSRDELEGIEEENNEPPWHWDAARYPLSSSSSYGDVDNPSIREITLRSMMGEYGGNAALLSLWFNPDPEVNQWQYEIQKCAAGVQHIWWAVHGLALASLIGVSVLVGIYAGEIVCNLSSRKEPGKASREKQKKSVPVPQKNKSSQKTSER
ncbi:hypothetical protein BGW36DRAFT_373832 [Talaromyces proteolyticus]|uniref:Calcineurin-like phosphoesterase domain-containing protein n=1 Tax=Talaromyces proteolyticus TaxID=1131652 RepID=A0AAD4KYC1_9EURO|nr:uncharacterized protein BGW36DRAFT_373832 [Talaromyces proteolyticus]KAH8700301.1 hypothetical protein BGW36DRAFT_373832 [Talaromyces proteolyticus]